MVSIRNAGLFFVLFRSFCVRLLKLLKGKHVHLVRWGEKKFCKTWEKCLTHKFVELELVISTSIEQRDQYHWGCRRHHTNAPDSCSTVSSNFSFILFFSLQSDLIVAARNFLIAGGKRSIFLRSLRKPYNLNREVNSSVEAFLRWK